MKLHLPLVLAVASVAPATAQDADPGTLVNNPAPAGFQIYGLAAKPKARKDTTVQYEQSVRIAIPESGGPIHKVGINAPTAKAVKAGDTLTMMVFVRLEAGEGGATTAPVRIQIQLAQAPYTGLFGKEISVGPTWQLFSISGKADRSYKPGEIAGTLHLASGKHVFDVGALVIFARP